MTPAELYQKFGICHPTIDKGVTPERYAKDVAFEIVTLHAPAIVRYSYSTAQREAKPNRTTEQASAGSLYTY
jgi:hypothetical protein